MNYVLGLDMGVASLGWAVISEDDAFIDTGVRIFPAGLDNFDSGKEKHPNQDRRLARGMRRRIRRKAERKKLVSATLTELAWIPNESTQLAKWHSLDVYELRHRAISEKITLLELGRIILHLNQRRGFLSLRKTEETEADKETKGMLGEISELEKIVLESGAKTLGNYLHGVYQKEGITQRLRNRHFSRKMLHHEFCLIWETQKKHHPQILTKALRFGSHGPAENGIKVATPIPRNKKESLLEQFGLENLTFFQRRVYWPKDSIGKCELEIGEFRAPIADRRFQEFRLLQEVNNLKITDHSAPGSPLDRTLTTEEKAEAVSYLTGKDKPKLDALKKHLCKNKNLPEFPAEPAQVTFNLESGGRTTISGTPTDAKLKASKGFGSGWMALPNDLKDQIVKALTLPAATDEDIRDALEKIPDLKPPQIDKLLSISLPAGYCHLSVIALVKLLPHMRDGLLYMHKEFAKSAISAAGYKRRDELERKALDRLPRFDELLDSKSPHFDPHQVSVNNPVVLRALTELRKVVNALIRKHGKPSRIHVEMARSLKMGPKQRKDYEKETKKFEKERTTAREILTAHNVIPTGDSLLLVRLWKEQKENCPYCDHSISQTQLFSGGGEIDIDHIYPFSRSADNSMANKVVCHRKCNADKKNQTPREWLEQSQPETYEKMIQRTKSLPSNKRKRFYAEEIPEGFVNRDLNDTAWMSKAACQYLARLMEKPHLVQGTKGMHTALLRNHWQLHSLLRNDGIDLKNRDDHRHHALDAVLIALCDQIRIKGLLAKQKFELKAVPAKEDGKRLYRLRNAGGNLDAPWNGFREAIEKSLNAIWVSHRPKRKVSGPLHKETNYGKTPEGLLVVRKPVESLSKKDVEGIRDEGIKKCVLDYIEQHGGDLTCLKAVSDDDPILMASGTRIRKVRTTTSYAHLTIRKGTEHETHVQSESTHHLAIFSLGEGKYHFEPVTLYEATRRLKNKEAVIQNTFPEMPSGAEFMFHLCSRDSMMATIDGMDQLFVFNTMATSTGQTWFAYHTDATQAHKDPVSGRSLLRSCMPGSFEKKFPNPRKVSLLPSGEIRSAH